MVQDTLDNIEHNGDVAEPCYHGETTPAERKQVPESDTEKKI